MLFQTVIVLTLARVNLFGVGADFIQQRHWNQAVMNYHIGAAQNIQPFDRDQSRIAGARAD
jgi:hypothetical protein